MMETGSRCGNFQRLALWREDGTVGWLNRYRLDRHLAGCPACRAFITAAGALTRQMADAVNIDPPDGVRRTLNALATDPATRAETRATDSARTRWTVAITGGAVLAAASGLFVALVRPAAFSGHVKPPSRLEERLVWAQQELDRFAFQPPANPGQVSLDDRIQSIERQLHCLDAALDADNWNTLMEDFPCTDS